jgi:ubiquinone/menaquinone biosynthesis C-methylase UbiE/DNA-binding HxlR family transcriptional regulator
MASILKLLRVVADPNRTRILRVLEKEELSVAELQEILGLGQSTLSTHLSQLKQAGLLEDRRTGKNIFYRLKEEAGEDDSLFSRLMEVLRQAARQLPETADDEAALALALHKRRDKVRRYFDELAGKFGRQYVPGRSWQGLAETFLLLIPPLVIADLGAGEGTVSQLLARRAREVIAVDNSDKMVAYGSDLARRHGVRNLHYRKGDLESLPIEDAAVDVAFFSQSLHHAPRPAEAIREAQRILKSRGRIIVLDLAKHHCEEARELYADLWLGFTEVELHRILKNAGFKNVSTSIVHREAEAPHFETLLATAEK